MKKGFFEALKAFTKGATVRKPALLSMKERAGMERLLFVVLFGDFLGIPVMRPYYALRLLPYAQVRIRPWMRSLLRERDLTDMAFD
jgi:hypothetical protein